MGAVTVERLLDEIARDQVVPERYSRRSFASRVAPVALMTVLAVGVVLTGVVLGRL